MLPNYNTTLLKKVRQVRKHSKVTGTLNSIANLTLVLEGVAGNAAWKDLALLVHEGEEEVRIFVVDVLDAVTDEAAVLLFASTNLRIGKELDIVSRSHGGFFLTVIEWGGLLFFLEAFSVARWDTGNGGRVSFPAADAVGCWFGLGGLFLLMTLSFADLTGTLVSVVLNAVLV